MKKNMRRSDTEKRNKLRPKPMIKSLLRKLQSSTDPVARNEIAMRIRDLRISEAVPVLIDLVGDPKNKGYTGTLVYALQKLDCKSYFVNLIDILIEGNYETSEMALSIVEKYSKSVGMSDLQIALRLLDFGRIRYAKHTDKVQLIDHVRSILWKTL